MQSEIRRKSLPFRFGWVDGHCHFDLITAFGISEVLLPNLAVYVPNRQRAVNLVGGFVYEDIKRFLERVFGGKLHPFAIEKPDFTRSECEKKGEKDDLTNKEIVDEVLAEDEQRKKDIGEGKGVHRKPKKKKGTKDKGEL